MEATFYPAKTLYIDGVQYTVEVLDDNDQVFYKISKESSLLFLIGISEQGIWEADREANPELVAAISNEIEKQEI